MKPIGQVWGQNVGRFYPILVVVPSLDFAFRSEEIWRIFRFYFYKILKFSVPFGIEIENGAGNCAENWYDRESAQLIETFYADGFFVVDVTRGVEA